MSLFDPMSKLIQRIIWLTVLIILSGCAAMSPMEEVDYTPSKAWMPTAKEKDYPGGTPDESNYIANTPIPDTLPKDTMNLSRLLDLALSHNPETRASWASARAAAANYGKSEAPYLPSIKFDGYMNRQREIRMGGAYFIWDQRYQGMGELSYLLFDFGGRRATMKEAKQLLLAANWEHNQTIQNIMYKVSVAYHMLIGQLANLTAAQSNFTEADTNYQSAFRRKQMGVATITDVKLAYARRAQRHLDVINAKGMVAIAKGNLATAMGYNAETALHVEIPEKRNTPHVNNTKIKDLIQKALKIRPEIAASFAKLRASQSAIKEAQSALYPTFHLNAGFGGVNVSGSAAFFPGQFANSGTLYYGALTMKYNVFEGFSLRNKVLEKQAMAEKIRAELERNEQKVAEEVWQSYQNVVTAKERIKASQALLTSASISYKAALLSYRRGVTQIVELLQAQSALAEARTESVNAKTLWYISIAELSHALGDI